jgi:ferritin-like metal-binding protein YciE
MAETTTLRSLLIDELRDVYHAERQLVKALPRMAKTATSDELRQLIESHLAETEEQVSRLEQAFELLQESPKAKVCEGMQGIVEEAADLIREEDEGVALDAALIAAAQRAEHYEIAAYGTLKAWAEALGESEVAELLSTTLDEEKAADEKLTALAEAGINEAATAGEEEEDDDEAEDAASGSRTSGSTARGNGVAARGTSSGRTAPGGSTAGRSAQGGSSRGGRSGSSR